jgi:hypothetical protein
MVSLRVVGSVGIGVGIDGIRTRDEEQGAAHGPGQHTEHQHRRPRRFTDHRIRHSGVGLPGRARGNWRGNRQRCQDPAETRCVADVISIDEQRYLGSQTVALSR